MAIMRWTFYDGCKLVFHNMQLHVDLQRVSTLNTISCNYCPQHTYCVLHTAYQHDKHYESVMCPIICTIKVNLRTLLVVLLLSDQAHLLIQDYNLPVFFLSLNHHLPVCKCPYIYQYHHQFFTTLTNSTTVPFHSIV
jgi:hypothetical protein